MAKGKAFQASTWKRSLTEKFISILEHFRCLCLLGKEIGFMERALQLFTKEKYIFAVQSPVVRCIWKKSWRCFSRWKSFLKGYHQPNILHTPQINCMQVWVCCFQGSYFCGWSLKVWQLVWNLKKNIIPSLCHSTVCLHQSDHQSEQLYCLTLCKVNVKFLA